MIKQFFLKLYFLMTDEGQQRFFEGVPTRDGGITSFSIARPPRSRTFIVWPRRNFELAIDEFQAAVRKEVGRQGFELSLN